MYPEIFDTSDEYASHCDNEATEMENLVDAHKSRARLKLVTKYKLTIIVKFSDQQVDTMKIPKKYRIGSEQKRHPVMVT